MWILLQCLFVYLTVCTSRCFRYDRSRTYTHTDRRTHTHTHTHILALTLQLSKQMKKNIKENAGEVEYFSQKKRQQNIFFEIQIAIMLDKLLCK